MKERAFTVNAVMERPAAWPEGEPPRQREFRRVDSVVVRATGFANLGVREVEAKARAKAGLGPEWTVIGYALCDGQWDVPME